jgi:hypothetical protein
MDLITTADIVDLIVPVEAYDDGDSDEESTDSASAPTPVNVPAYYNDDLADVYFGADDDADVDSADAGIPFPIYDLDDDPSDDNDYDLDNYFTY